jgi:uncharacterized protein
MVAGIIRNTMRGDRRDNDTERADFGESGRGLSSGLSWDLATPARPSGRGPGVQRDILSISSQLEPALTAVTDPARNKRSLAALGFSALGAAILGGAGPAPLDQAIAAYRAGRMVEARTLSEPLANAGNSQAATMLGFMFEQGLGGAKDEPRAVAYYRQAAEKNDADALIALGRLGLDNRGQITLVETQSFLARAADLGRTDAASLLGGALLDARFGTRDANGAARWLKSAADGGDAEAAYMLALLKIEGDGVPQDRASGLEFLKQAANKNHPAAMADYGLMLYQGKTGEAPSKGGAANWFAKAAKAGDSEGQFLYAYALATGEGVARDPIQAYVWVLRSNAQASGAPEYDQDRVKLKSGLEKILRPDEVAKAAIEAQKPLL